MLSVDDLQEMHDLGDQRVATTPSDSQPDVPPRENREYPNFITKNGHRQLRPYPLPGNAANIPAGTLATITSDEGEPDAWLITVRSLAGANGIVEVHLGSGRGPAPIGRLGGGGWCRIPGRTPYVTLVSVGAAAAYVTVAAASGWGGLELGDIEIVPGNVEA